MEWWKFESMIKTGSLYFRRIDHFDDRLEGRAPQAVWNLSGPEVQEWYRTNREYVFVCCFHLAEDESAAMWKEYAKNNGVMIYTTVGALRRELSEPEPAAGTSVIDTPQDGFTVGVVEYVDLDRIDVHTLMSEGLSNTTPMFRKGEDYIHELEYRAILRPGSATGEKASGNGEFGAEIPVRLDRLVQEIRFCPTNDPSRPIEIEALLTEAGLDIPVQPSRLGVQHG
jgi:hypothetical protein